MNTSSRLPSRTPSVTPRLAVVPAVTPAPAFVPMPRPRAANANAAPDPERLARRRAIADLYADARPSLAEAARRLVGSRADAADIVQEAFAVLLESPSRKPTRAAAWCIVRDLARERRAEQATMEEYREDDVVVMSEAGAWLEGVLGG